MTLVKAARTIVLAVALAAPCAARAAAPAWGRRVEFARGLALKLRYDDLAKSVIDDLLADATIQGEDKANLYRAVAEYYVKLIENVRGGKDSLARVAEYMARARDFFGRYVNHEAIKRRPTNVEERFEIRVRLVWLTVAEARVRVRMFDDPGETPKEKAGHQADAVKLYQSAIKEFEALAAEKAADQAKEKARAPQEKAARAKWEEKYNAVRTAHLQVRIYLNDVRVELGKFLKKADPKSPDWKSFIQTACREFKQLLLDFSDAQGIISLNVNYAEAMVELGPEQDQEALERLQDVWNARESFQNSKAIPCKAAHVKAAILLRQKKYDDVLDALDEMLKFRTEGAWNPEVVSAEKVTELLVNLEAGESPQQYDRNALGGSLRLMAETYAEMGSAAANAKKSSKEVKRLYGIAYQILVGVWSAKVPMDARYAELMQRCREKGDQPLSPEELSIQLADALKKAERDKTEYLRAARLYTELLGRAKQDLEGQRKAWDNIARCYYGGGDYYSAYIVFSAMARWFPKPEPQALAYGQSAVAAIKAQHDAATKAKATAQASFDAEVLRAAYAEMERLSPLGPGATVVNDGALLREKGEFAKAIERLREVRPESPAYPYAIYQIALTYRGMLKKATDADPKSLEAARLRKAMLDAFQTCLDHARKALPGLKDPDKAPDRERLLEATAMSLAIYCESLLQETVGDPVKALDITTSLRETYPGIEKAFAYPLILYNRMHAAYLLATRVEPDRAADKLAIIEDCWKLLKEFKDFKYIANACRMGAGAHSEVARKLEEQAKRTADASAKAELEKRARAERNRGLEFYLELITIAPRQEFRTYRYVLFELDRREHEPKSADYRKIVELAPSVIQAFSKSPDIADQVNQIRLLLASAHSKLGSWRDAIPLLEEVNDAYEPEFQARMKKFERDKANHDKDPARFPAPRRPVRSTIQLQAREALARAYLAAGATSKLNDVLLICVDLLELYADRSNPKHWEALYVLCEAYRLSGKDRYDDLVKQLFRASGAIEQNTLKPPAKGTRKDFLALATTLLKDIERLPDAALKEKLMAPLTQAIKTLSQ